MPHETNIIWRKTGPEKPLEGIGAAGKCEAWGHHGIGMTAKMERTLQ